MPVRLALARARPEIVAMDDERLFFFVASFVDDSDAALLSDRAVGEECLVLHNSLEQLTCWRRRKRVQRPSSQMSFIPAVQREINNRQPSDPVRVALEYLLQNAIGRQNPVPLPTIVAQLQARGINISETGFQQTVLAESRDRDFYIGSGRRGYFLIDKIADAQGMRDFYETRIRAEQQNLDNLRRQARAVGWNI